MGLGELRNRLGELKEFSKTAADSIVKNQERTIEVVQASAQENEDFHEDISATTHHLFRFTEDHVLPIERKVDEVHHILTTGEMYTSPAMPRKEVYLVTLPHRDGEVNFTPKKEYLEVERSNKSWLRKPPKKEYLEVERSNKSWLRKLWNVFYYGDQDGI